MSQVELSLLGYSKNFHRTIAILVLVSRQSLNETSAPAQACNRCIVDGM